MSDAMCCKSLQPGYRRKLRERKIATKTKPKIVRMWAAVAGDGTVRYVNERKSEVLAYRKYGPVGAYRYSVESIGVIRNYTPMRRKEK